MNNKSSVLPKEILLNITTVIPLTISMAVCSGMGIFTGLVFSCISSLLFSFTEEKRRMPIYLSFLVISYAFNAINAAGTSLAILISGLLLIIFSVFKKNKFKQINPAVSAALMLSGALTVTVLFTTDYFGIGATGNTTKEMIASYISLGFHPNWRGVLYGTIVMVIMITFPRKFKKTVKFFDFAFLALILTTVMNLFLNPLSVINVINEVGTISFTEYKNNLLFPLINSFSDTDIINSLICSVALFFINYSAILQNNQPKKSDLIINGAVSSALGFCSCLISISQFRKNKLFSGALSAIITAVLFILFKDFIPRIPVHSCAVILIVGAWNSVKWSEIKQAFSVAESIICFTLTVILCLLLGITIGTALACILSVIYFSLKNRPFSKDS